MSHFHCIACVNFGWCMISDQKFFPKFALGSSYPLKSITTYFVLFVKNTTYPYLDEKSCVILSPLPYAFVWGKFQLIATD
jgi:hypothetical protein